MLLAMLPFLLPDGGPGGRNGHWMGVLHVSPSLALATSVGFGFSMLFASLPGCSACCTSITEFLKRSGFLSAGTHR